VPPPPSRQLANGSAGDGTDTENPVSGVAVVPGEVAREAGGVEGPRPEPDGVGGAGAVRVPEFADPPGETGGVGWDADGLDRGDVTDAEAGGDARAEGGWVAVAAPRAAPVVVVAAVPADPDVGPEPDGRATNAATATISTIDAPTATPRNCRFIGSDASGAARTRRPALGDAMRRLPTRGAGAESQADGATGQPRPS